MHITDALSRREFLSMLSGISAQLTVNTRLENKGPSSSKHFLEWSFGNSAAKGPIEAGSSRFSFHFNPTVRRVRRSFRAEVQRACEKVVSDGKNGKLAVCYSGGVDSEIIAVTLAKLGVPFEMYFGDFWGQNRRTYDEWVKPFFRKFPGRGHVIHLNRDEFISSAEAMFQTTGCEFPTYLGVAAMFDRIPRDQFLVVGDGDLDRHGPLWPYISNRTEHLATKLSNRLWVPFAYSSVFYDVWARQNLRRGQFYFYRSTPELVASVAADPAFRAQRNVKAILNNAFPEVSQRPKTTNWDLGDQENVSIRTHLYRIATNNPRMIHWEKSIGTMVDLDNLFTA